MTVVDSSVGVPSGAPTSQGSSGSVLTLLLKVLGLMMLNAIALIIVYSFFRDDNLGLAAVVAVIAVGANIIVFVPRLYPLRWMLPGLALITLLVIYPIIFTVSTSFTNFGDGHRLGKTQAIAQIERVGGFVVPDEAADYSWTLFINEAETEFALWLTRTLPDGTGETLWAPAGGEIQVVADAPTEAPETYEGLTLRARPGTLLRTIQATLFGTAEDQVTIQSTRSAIRASLELRYQFDEARDVIVDTRDDKLFEGDEELGFFVEIDSEGRRPVNPQGQFITLQPGYRVGVGFFNFTRMFSDPGLRGPLIDIFTWTVAFAFGSVLFTFSMGLVMAMILNDPNVPFRPVIRSLLIIPYAIPGVISIVVWRGMLNLNLGFITEMVAGITGSRPQFLLDPWLAKFSILLVNLWLGYPYMMLVCSGALQSIPSEVYEAAAVDGARPWQRFWQITLPLLLVSVGPLLIASFTFNFNNYLLVEALTGADAPPIPNSPVPATYADILISYTYKIAFGNRGSDYGYASAITIIIFLVVAAVTLMQYRFTKTWEQVGENV